MRFLKCHRWQTTSGAVSVTKDDVAFSTTKPETSGLSQAAEPWPTRPGRAA
jgi:hypothetical protein